MFFIFNPKELSVNRKGLRASTLVGLIWENPVLDPLAVLHLDNQLYFCTISGKSNLTYEEAIESEKTARKRLGNIPKALKNGLVWLAHHTQRGRFLDLADDVYVFANARYFIGEVVEAIVKDQWCDCKIIKVNDTLIFRIKC